MLFTTLALASAISLAFSAATSSAVQQRVEAAEVDKEQPFDNGISLRSVEAIPLSRKAFRAIALFDPYLGRARLSNGQCVWLRSKRASESAPCTDLPSSRNERTGLPCDGQRSTVYVGDWHMRCVRLRNGQSALVAVGARPENKDREVTLAVLEEEVGLFKVFSIHPGIADVTTVGWRRDGKVGLSSFSWIGEFTGTARQNSKAR